MRFVVLVFLSCTYYHALHAETMGPFEAQIHSIGPCPAAKSGKNLAIFKSKQVKISRKKYNLSVDLSLSAPLTDDIGASVVLAKKTPQGWKDNYFQLEMKSFCAGAKKFIPEFMTDIITSMNVKQKGCPLPKGNYTDLTVRSNVNVQNLPAFFYSVFRVRITAYGKSTSDVLACMDVEVETVPKRL